MVVTYKKVGVDISEIKKIEAEENNIEAILHKGQEKGMEGSWSKWFKSSKIKSREAAIAMSKKMNKNKDKNAFKENFIVPMMVLLR